MNTAFLLARITATQNQIIAMEAAIDAIVTGAAASWSLDTGQTKETVTKKNLSTYQASLDVLYNRLATLEARLNGANIQTLPAW